MTSSHIFCIIFLTGNCLLCRGCFFCCIFLGCCSFTGSVFSISTIDYMKDFASDLMCYVSRWLLSPSRLLADLDCLYDVDIDSNVCWPVVMLLCITMSSVHVVDDRSAAVNATLTKNVTDDDQNSSSSAAASSVPSGTRRDIYAESASQHDQYILQDIDSDVVVVTDEIAYQKLRGSKETIFTKLKNRIRTLEDNLNLTNR